MDGPVKPNRPVCRAGNTQWKVGPGQWLNLLREFNHGSLTVLDSSLNRANLIVERHIDTRCLSSTAVRRCIRDESNEANAAITI